MRPVFRFETICPAIAASPVRATFWDSTNARFASATSLSVGPSFRKRWSSSFTAAVTLSMFAGLVLTVTVKRGDRVTRRSGQRRGRAVGESVLLADPVAQSRGERAAAENEVADPERGVVGSAVRQRERKPGEVFGVGLVRRENVFLQSCPLRRPCGRFAYTESSIPIRAAFPSPAQRALRVEVADDREFGVAAADLCFINRS